MGRIRRGGYVFEFWVGDHPPRHVHVYRDHRLIAKVKLDERLKVMEGKVSRRLRKMLETLMRERSLA